MGDCAYELRTFWRGRKRAIPSQVLRPHYEKHVGPIPDGHHLHHDCLDPACSNVAHIATMTREDHIAEHRRLRSLAT